MRSFAAEHGLEERKVTRLLDNLHTHVSAQKDKIAALETLSTVAPLGVVRQAIAIIATPDSLLAAQQQFEASKPMDAVAERDTAIAAMKQAKQTHDNEIVRLNEHIDRLSAELVALQRKYADCEQVCACVLYECVCACACVRACVRVCVCE